MKKFSTVLASFSLALVASACTPPSPGADTASDGSGDDDDAEEGSEDNPDDDDGGACPNDQEQCDGDCVSVLTDESNCGECGNSCGSGSSCVEGTCTCQDGFESCDGACVDPQSDPDHCGGCGEACSAEEVCSLGGCSDECSDGLTACGRNCVDLDTSVLHCGECENACDGGRLCEGGDCACEVSDELECEGTCVDVTSDPSHCGECGNACSAGAACQASACVMGTDSEDSYINPDGKVDPAENAFGIQGNWYAFGDGITSEETGNPYRDGAYCITGNAPGDGDFTTHWGAGIGLDLNYVDGEKLPYELEGRLNGFRMKIEGEAPVAPRVTFVNSLEEDTNPFTLAVVGEGKDYWIAEARVPFDWSVANAGSVVDNGVLYSLQVLVPGGDAAGPIDICITEFQPLYDPTHVAAEPEGTPFINSDAFIDPEKNPYGIVGPVYAITDGNSSSQRGNPYKDGKYCIAGEFTGSTDDWGAGIAFDLNRVPGTTRAGFQHEGKIEGFLIALSGHSPGRARIQYVINEPQEDGQPFLEAHLNTTMGYRLDWAQIPASWDVPGAGTVVGDEVFVLQVFLESGTAGPFEVCIEDFQPATAEELAIAAEPAASGYQGAITIDDAILEREYELWKSLRYQDCGDGSACVPRDEGDCISEGTGYGMLLAVGFDDRDAFDKLWTYYTRHRNGANLMAWRSNACGSTIDSGAATDGDIDAAMALIQAACKWGGNYETDARGVISALRNSAIDTSCGSTVLKPGEGFGGCGRTNPSYYAPGYFKIFQQMTGDSAWGNLVNDGYTMLAAQQSRNNGMVTDWCDASGNAMGGLNGEEVRYGPDASRTPWRVAIDYMWNGDERAVTFLNNVAGYVEDNGGVARLFTPNSNFRGAVAFSAIHQDPVKAKEWADAWLTTAVDDETYFPGTLRAVYMLLAANRFPSGCN